VPERRDLRDQLREDAFTRDEQLDGLDALRERRIDEILPFGREQPALLTMLAGREKLPDEPELLVLT